jgi:hypothetical protein
MQQQWWISLGVAIVTWGTTIIAFMRKSELDKLKLEADFDKRISILLDRIDRYEKDFHQHEMGNEKQFENYHTELRTDFDKVFKAIDGLKDTLLALLANGQLKIK